MAETGSVERAVLRVCRSGLDVTELQRQVLAALRGVMTIDAAFYPDRRGRGAGGAAVDARCAPRGVRAGR